MSAVNGAEDPIAASVESAPVISAACAARWARKRPASASAVAWRRPGTRRAWATSATGVSHRALQRLGAGKPFALIECFRLAHHHGRHMGERCQITGRADGAFLRNERGDTLFQHALDEPYQVQADTGGATPERDQLQCHDQAHDLVCKRLAHAAAMRENQIALQRLRIGRIDLDRGKFAEAGIDAVDRRVAGGDFRNARGRLLDTGVEAAVEYGAFAAPVDLREFSEGDAAGVKRNGHDRIPLVMWPFQMR